MKIFDIAFLSRKQPFERYILHYWAHSEKKMSFRRFDFNSQKKKDF